MATQFNLDWKVIWRRFVQLRLRPAVKSFTYKYLHNVTTWQVRTGICTCHAPLASFWHLTGCGDLAAARINISSQLFLWFQVTVSWSKAFFHSTFSANKQNRYCSLVAIWVLWRIRNKLLHQNTSTTNHEISYMLQEELSRTILLHFRLSPTTAKFWCTNNNTVRYNERDFTVSLHWN